MLRLKVLRPEQNVRRVGGKQEGKKSGHLQVAASPVSICIGIGWYAVKKAADHNSKV